MRELAVAVAVSVAAHVVAIVWLVENQPAPFAVSPVDDDEAAREPSRDRVDPIAAVTSDAADDEITVVLFDAVASSAHVPTVPVEVRPATTPTASHPAARHAAAVTVRSPDNEIDDTTVREAVASALAMRHPGSPPRDVNLALSAATANEIVSRRAETPPAPTAADAQNAADEAAGAEAAKLRAEIKELDQMLFSPGHLERTDGATLEAEREELGRKKKDLAQMSLHHVGGGRYESNFNKQFTAHIDPDGTTHLEDAPNFKWEGLGFRFDLTDAAMRQFGDDPYQRQKMRFLDRTRQQRYEIGTAYRERQLEHSGDYMRKAIERVWATIPDPAKQREALFELWDDCAETGEPKLLEAGDVARRLVMGVIRTKVAYTPEELVRFNARRTSTQRFEP